MGVFRWVRLLEGLDNSMDESITEIKVEEKSNTSDMIEPCSLESISRRAFFDYTNDENLPQSKPLHHREYSNFELGNLN